MYKKLITAAFLLSICTCYAYDPIDDMRLENEQRMDKMLDRLHEERSLAEQRRANDEQERVNRITVEGQNRRLFGNKQKTLRH